MRMPRPRRAYLGTVVIALVMCGCADGPPSPTSTSAFNITPFLEPSTRLPVSPIATLDLIAEAGTIDALARRRVTVDDPVYKRRKTYEGPLLSDVVARLASGRSVASDAHLVMVCLDGYRAGLRLSEANEQTVLARRDVDAPSGWMSLPGKGASASPGPSYLVWTTADAASRPWPYGVSAIEIWATDPLERAKPGDRADADVRAGFTLFAEHCARCHRVNGAGGALSSELNVPANVTEYWQPAALRAFIREPSSVQAGARMPAFDRLSTSDLDRLTSYLTAMKLRKLPPR